MLKKLFVTAAAAAAVSVPLAGMAWADPPFDPGSNGKGIGQGGVPTRAGATLDAITAVGQATNPALRNLNLNGTGNPSPPGSMHSIFAKKAGNTPDATGAFVDFVYKNYLGFNTAFSNTKLPPGLTVKSLTPGCASGRIATDPGVNNGKPICN